MSKAFTKEGNEEAFEPEDGESEPSPLPAGTKNYITPGGMKRLRDEYTKLLEVERPKIVEVVAWAAGNGDRSENADYLYGKRRLREIDKRLRFLGKRMDAAEVVDPAASTANDTVRFGATVTVLDEDGNEKVYSILGIDETDPKSGRISWISPLGRALLKHRVGDTVTFHTPKGEQELKIIAIEYKSLD